MTTETLWALLCLIDGKRQEPNKAFYAMLMDFDISSPHRLPTSFPSVLYTQEMFLVTILNTGVPANSRLIYDSADSQPDKKRPWLEMAVLGKPAPYLSYLLEENRLISVDKRPIGQFEAVCYTHMHNTPFFLFCSLDCMTTFFDVTTPKVT